MKVRMWSGEYIRRVCEGVIPCSVYTGLTTRNNFFQNNKNESFAPHFRPTSEARPPTRHSNRQVEVHSRVSRSYMLRAGTARRKPLSPAKSGPAPREKRKRLKRAAALVPHGAMWRTQPKRLANLTWQPDVLHEDTIDLEGLTIRKQEGGNTWTVASSLPISGVFSWHVRIDACHKDYGAIFIGVCDVGGTVAWVLSPYTGNLHCIRQGQPLEAEQLKGSATRVIMDENGRPSNLRRRANGTVVEVAVDFESGALGFRIKPRGAVEFGPLLPALLGLPHAEKLLPCVGLHRAGDQVSLLCRGLTPDEGVKVRDARARRRLIALQQQKGGAHYRARSGARWDDLEA